jgi:F-type H+-transporting ATPase subunit gamma
MASAREIKNRIRSVKNIAQIARALEAEAATKVRRAQARALASRAFSEKAWEILLNVQATAQGQSLHPLLTARTDIKRIMIVLVTADRGLCGAYNTNITRAALRFSRRMGKPVDFITVGRKGRDSLIRAGANVIADFSHLPNNPVPSDVAPAAHIAIDEFLSGKVDDVFIAYTDFINTLTQRPSVLPWLPLIPHNIDDTVAAEYVKEVPAVTSQGQKYEYEPNAEAIINEIVPRFTELQLYQAVLESQASEYSARMVAMRNASDNAAQLTTDLTLEYNKARQAAITSEILDIVGGAEALSDSLAAAASEMAVHYQGVLEPNGKSAASAKKSTSKPASKPAASKAKAPAKASKAAGTDDLRRIEGIGPKMSAALKSAGIASFAQLADASEDDLREAISQAGMNFSPSLATWAEQAAFAARGDWDGLAAYQDELVAGRKA